YEKGAYYASIAVDSDPTLASAYLIQGKCQKEMGQTECARMSFEKALALDITLSEALEEKYDRD
ncbi:MAG: hypothetical protein ABRQ37_21600, partial [Candidatus Eremiobacterota bacterium]